MAKLYVSNKDETPRMFESDFLEAFSKVHWSVPLWLYTPVVGYFVFRSFAIYKFDALSVVLYFVLGMIFWTLAEYSIHRWAFHFHPKSDLGKRLIFIFHGVHHDYPRDSKRLVMPPSASVPLAALFYFIFLYALGPAITAPFFAGFIAGYIYYDTTHYAIHHFNLKSKFWLFVKNHHALHHYLDPELGFGVSQPFWDYVFRTQYKKEDLKKEALRNNPAS